MDILVVKMLLKTKFTWFCDWGAVLTEKWWPHQKLQRSKMHNQEGWLEGCENWKYSRWGYRTRPWSHQLSWRPEAGKEGPSHHILHPSHPHSCNSLQLPQRWTVWDQKFFTHSFLHPFQSGPVAFRFCLVTNEGPLLKRMRTKSNAFRKSRS